MNIMLYIESFLKNLEQESTNNFFLFVLSGIFFFTLFFILINRKWQNEKIKDFIQYAPTFLTSVGILGTFTGIVSALLNFDITDVNGSISALLAGMKTAFLTSVIGVVLSVILKPISLFGEKKVKIDDNEGDNIVETVVNNLVEQSKGIAQLVTQQNDYLIEHKSLVKAIGGDGDSSLLSQLMRLRTDISDQTKQAKDFFYDGQKRFGEFNQELFNKLDDFAEKMSKSATEQVIEALKQVIIDFNNNLTEQFGENFKKLNEAVLHLVQWQENYKHQLIEMEKQYALGVQAISNTEYSVKQIEQSSSIIPKTMEDLKDVLTVNQHQLNELDNHLSAFADVRNKAVEALPEIKSQIQLTLENMKDAGDTLTQGIARNSEELTGSLENANKALNEKLENGAEMLSFSILEVSKELSENIKQSSGELNNNIKEITGELTQSIIRNSEELTASLENANKALNEKLENGAEMLSNNIAEVSEDLTRHLEENSEELNQRISDITQELATELRSIITQFVENSEMINRTLADNSNNLQRESKQINDNLQQYQQKFGQVIEDTHSRFRMSVDELVRKHIDESGKMLSTLEVESKNALKVTAESVQKQIDTINKSLENELTSVFNHFGNALAQIATGLTKSYDKAVNDLNNRRGYR